MQKSAIMKKKFVAKGVELKLKPYKLSGLGLNSRGFTIIEVLIVLAIAGLIMLIVFLAVPALQRNSRNTTYRSEAHQLLVAAGEFVNNSGNTLPAASGSGTAGSDAAKILAFTKNKNITTLTVATAAAVTALSPTLNTAQLEYSVKCGTTGGTTVTPTTTGAAARSAILVYAVENSDGTVNAQCTGT